MTTLKPIEYNIQMIIIYKISNLVNFNVFKIQNIHEALTSCMWKLSKRHPYDLQKVKNYACPCSDAVIGNMWFKQ